MGERPVPGSASWSATYAKKNKIFKSFTITSIKWLFNDFSFSKVRYDQTLSFLSNPNEWRMEFQTSFIRNDTEWLVTQRLWFKSIKSFNLLHAASKCLRWDWFSSVHQLRGVSLIYAIINRFRSRCLTFTSLHSRIKIFHDSSYASCCAMKISSFDGHRLHDLNRLQSMIKTPLFFVSRNLEDAMITFNLHCLRWIKDLPL